jgi:putative DNA primase/helicase
MNTFYDYAREALTLGLHVFPLGVRSKHPIPGTHGFKDSSAEPERARLWWAANPNFNIGIDCGASGIAVVDIDAGLASKEEFDTWLAGSGLPPTYTVHTGRRSSYGVQMYFRGEMRSSGSKKFSLNGCTGEVKAVGGYVVGAGSVHPDSGERYEIINDVAFAELPELVRAAVAKTAVNVSVKLPSAANATQTGAGKIPSGSWHNLLVSWAGICFNAGVTDPEELYRALKLYARSNFDLDETPLDEAKVKAIALNCAASFQPAPPTGVSEDWEPITPTGPQEQDHQPVNHTRALVSAKQPKLFNFTDAGNMERLVYWYGDGFKYCPQRSWYIWDGKRWAADAIGKVQQAAISTVRAIPGLEIPLALAELDPSGENFSEIQDATIARIKQFAKSSESKKSLDAMKGLSKSATGLAANITEFDRDNWKFNCQNMTLGLYQREQHPHRPADMITSVSPVNYDPAATCPLWDKFLLEIMQGNADNIAFLQRAAGYSLTGSAAEQCMFVLWGNGDNGKSTFLEVLQYIVGDYGSAATMGMFLDTDYDAIPNELAGLAGIRFVSASESKEGRRLDEAKIKVITGSDTIKARFLHREFFNFRPEFKIWLSTNHRPAIRGTDDGIWRRIRLVPFTWQVPKGKKDKRLRGKLIAEASGILNWMIRGLEDYRLGDANGDGLRESVDVVEATRSYRCDENWIAQFLEAETEPGNSFSVQAKDMYARYKTWASNGGERVLSGIVVNRAMDAAGIKSDKPNGKKMYLGIRLRLVGSGDTLGDAPEM